MSAFFFARIETRFQKQGQYVVTHVTGCEPIWVAQASWLWREEIASPYSSYSPLNLGDGDCGLLATAHITSYSPRIFAPKDS